MKHYTDVTVLIDRSGSMGSIKREMEQALKQFVKGHKQVPSTRMTFIEFDDITPLHILYEDTPVSQIEKITIHPRGNTPLFDAFCRAIDHTGARLSGMSESSRPDQVLFVVITDGQENASKEFSRSNVRDRVKKQTNSFSWQFVYLGANQDTFAEAQSFGIPSGWALHYNLSQKGITGAAAALLGSTVSYTSNTGSLRGNQMRSFSADERTEADSQDPPVNPPTYGGSGSYTPTRSD